MIFRSKFKSTKQTGIKRCLFIVWAALCLLWEWSRGIGVHVRTETLHRGSNSHFGLRRCLPRTKGWDNQEVWSIQSHKQNYYWLVVPLRDDVASLFWYRRRVNDCFWHGLGVIEPCLLSHSTRQSPNWPPVNSPLNPVLDRVEWVATAPHSSK